MPPKCQVCYSPVRPAIEADLLREKPYRVIGRQYGINYQAIARHHKNHMEGPPGKYGPYQPPSHPAPSLDDVKAVLEASQTPQAAAKAQEDVTVVDRLEGIMSRLEGLLTEAKGRPASVQLPILREMRFQIELLSKLLGELREGPTINVLLHPNFQTAIAVLDQALAPYPEARLTVSKALDELAEEEEDMEVGWWAR